MDRLGSHGLVMCYCNMVKYRNNMADDKEDIWKFSFTLVQVSSFTFEVCENGVLDRDSFLATSVNGVE